MSPARGAQVISDGQLDEAIVLLGEPDATIASVSRKMGLSDPGLRYALERRRGITGRRYSKHLADDVLDVLDALEEGLAVATRPGCPLVSPAVGLVGVVVAKPTSPESES